MELAAPLTAPRPPGEAIRRVIKEPAFREAARHLGRIIAEDARQSIGIQKLEHIAGGYATGADDRLTEAGAAAASDQPAV